MKIMLKNIPALGDQRVAHQLFEYFYMIVNILLFYHLLLYKSEDSGISGLKRNAG